MPGQITEQLTHSAYASSGTPLSGSYSQVGSVLVSIGPLSWRRQPRYNRFPRAWVPPGTSSGDLEVIFLVASMRLRLANER